MLQLFFVTLGIHNYTKSMLESKIKEELSLYLFTTLAARMGYAAILPRFDQGTDIILKKSIILSFGN